MRSAADLVIASEDARIGTPYSRMWGAYLSGMWIYRLGLTRAKEYALTGQAAVGQEAAEVGLINRAVPFALLEATVAATAQQLAEHPVVAALRHEAGGEPGLREHGSRVDADARHHPGRLDAQHAEAKRFIEVAEEKGVRAAIAQRDGAFGDYSQAPKDQQPDPNNEIEVKRKP